MDWIDALIGLLIIGFIIYGIYKTVTVKTHPINEDNPFCEKGHRLEYKGFKPIHDNTGNLSTLGNPMRNIAKGERHHYWCPVCKKDYFKGKGTLLPGDL